MVLNPAWENIYLYLNKFQDFSTGCIKGIFFEGKKKTTLFKCQEMHCVLIYKYTLQVPSSLSLKYFYPLSSGVLNCTRTELFPDLNTVGTLRLTNHARALQSTRLRRSKPPY